MRTISQSEANEYVKKATAHTKKIAASREKSLDLLVEAGICTPAGRLRKPYRPEKVTQVNPQLNNMRPAKT